MRTARLAAALGYLALACGGGPRLPQDVTFEGVRLEKATDWSSGNFEGVVFIPPGEKLDTASLQVGVIVSTERATGATLNDWILEQYRRSPVARWHDQSGSDEACKIGLGAGPAIRPFVAVHVCRTGVGVAACAEADEQLPDEYITCPSDNPGCWTQLCSEKLDERRDALEALVRQAAPAQ